MEKLLDTINFKYSDPVIAEKLASIGNQTSDFSLHFNQNEDAFIESNRKFRIPSFPVHHNVNQVKPSDTYLDGLRKLTNELFQVFPSVFTGTRYFFDPAEVLRPCFIQIFKVEDNYYLYLLRLDLNIRLADSTIITQATNDATAEFETGKLFIESLIIPVYKPDINASGGIIPINRLFNSTWVGESGTGYHINGHWIDRELTKFLTALYMKEGVRAYPYYPFRCDFNTVSFFPAILSLPGRREFLGYLHKSLPMISSDIPKIEESMKKVEFTKDNSVYLDLKKKIPTEWTKIWTSLKIKPYLNENDMKEYSLEFTFPE